MLIECQLSINWDANQDVDKGCLYLIDAFSTQDKNCKNKKDQQLAKAKAWEAEMKRKCKPMKPVTLGCLWLEDAALNLTLKQFAACLLIDEPINVESSSTSSRSNEVVPGDTSSSTSTSGALYVPDEGNF